MSVIIIIDIVDMLCTRPSVKFVEALTDPQPNYQPCITVYEVSTL